MGRIVDLFNDIIERLAIILVYIFTLAAAVIFILLLLNMMISLISIIYSFHTEGYDNYLLFGVLFSIALYLIIVESSKRLPNLRNKLEKFLLKITRTLLTPRFIILIILICGFLIFFSSLHPFNQPEIKITSSSDIIHDQEIITGTAKNIPEEYELWVVVYDHRDDKYYPQQRVNIQDGKWSVPISLGTKNKNGDKFDIVVVLANKQASDIFTAYFATGGIHRGLDDIPEGAKVYSETTVISLVEDTVGNYLEKYGRKAQIEFNPPENMKIGETKIVEANINKNASEILIKEIVNNEHHELIIEKNQSISESTGENKTLTTNDITVTPNMQVTLIGKSDGDFDIETIPPNFEGIYSIDENTTTWKWKVTPKKSGEQTFLLSINCVVPENDKLVICKRSGYFKELEVNTYVEKSPYYFLETHWQWIAEFSLQLIIALASLTLAIISLIRKYKKLNKEKRLPSKIKNLHIFIFGYDLWDYT